MLNAGQRDPQLAGPRNDFSTGFHESLRSRSIGKDYRRDAQRFQASIIAACLGSFCAARYTIYQHSVFEIPFLNRHSLVRGPRMESSVSSRPVRGWLGPGRGG